MTDVEKAWHPWNGDTRLAHCFQPGMDELNALFPDRPQGGQEGTIGDSAHQAEPTSDHNPNSQGVVRAWDIQTEGAPFDGQKLANYLARMMQDTPGLPFFGAFGYVIYSRQITAWQPWGTWQSYNGTDPHDRHIHVSAGRLESEYDNRSPWNLATAFGHNPPPAPLPAPVSNQPTQHETKGNDMPIIVTPGAVPLPMLIDGGKAVRILQSTTWTALQNAGVKTVQIDKRDYDNIQKNFAK